MTHLTPPAQAVFDSLLGQWTLSRTISGYGAFHGTAHFRPLQPGVLHYREDGELQSTTGSRTPAYREYFYVLRDDHLRICFTDTPPDSPTGGRVLHDLLPTRTGPGPWPVSATAVHHCGHDIYTGHYDFHSPDQTHVTITVTGPAKDYTIHSTYRRP
ncbi:hypothetical protein LX15_001337 [Streptoalloteichus tenebrarius]|uniref:DUF6314 domain-containing protein n=1 Tax=Streptoalloteichus tenebrarius (strain ATCC 17920 / DSM 40477 / JCM 4838 / CBS 697.72 / NBRC 16177 / NCIMB 11028 / NRRL B-12390 / A12253. 1 / ISP 5477) TaxID=1933 RepID=A0ABT1HQ64_STRSD|nr:DUF6314 family protein [Streptoalloteichus tenebrarius]MCP2257652.1 hypothetical protein [Streptoalloteichus tenebrarius]BFE98613.1 hypothetical protein GCM10020241_02890 [Streptoalloteichus tenebrarius]